MQAHCKGVPRKLLQHLLHLPVRQSCRFDSHCVNGERSPSGMRYAVKEIEMKKASSHSGSCFCGAVQFTVSDEPVAMGYCHCDSCRHWSAGPVNAFTLWKPDALRVTRGADLIGTYHKTERSNRKWCKSCGGHVFTEHPGWGVIDVYAAVIPGFRFTPGLHVNYQETVLRIKDGLPKLKDYPKEMGGSGEIIPE